MTAATEKTYSTLLGRIQRGELRSGDFLVEADLAGQLGVSRTPVREAIRRLAAEGLVQTGGRRRAVVRDFDEERVTEIYELRSRLESYAAERAASRIDAEQVASLRTLAEAMEACAQRADQDHVALFADLNDKFHQVILDAARAPHLEAALRPVLQIQLILLQRYQHTIAEHLERSCWHHRELIRAFELRDPLLAGQQMQLHMLSASAAADRVPATQAGTQR